MLQRDVFNGKGFPLHGGVIRMHDAAGTAGRLGCANAHALAAFATIGPQNVRMHTAIKDVRA